MYNVFAKSTYGDEIKPELISVLVIYITVDKEVNVSCVDPTHIRRVELMFTG
jgi:septum formation topological specificity factor MinE